MKANGWYVNLAVRRVEPITLVDSIYNTGNYAKYQGPKRTYMLFDSAVHPTEKEATASLWIKLNAIYYERDQRQKKLWGEIAAVSTALAALEP